MKKNIKIFTIIFIAIICLGIVIFLFSRFTKDKDNSISDIQVNTDDIDVSIFKTSENAVEEIIEDETNYGDASVSIEGEKVDISLGSLEILRKGYVPLKDEFYLIEALIGKREGLPVRNDAELSTNYDNCLYYAKKWYLYNKETKEHYLVEDNTLTNELSLNPKVINVDGISYFEFDKMFNYIRTNTDVEHYSIELDEFIANACSGQSIDYLKYSTINKPTFTQDNETYSVEAERDLNNDGKVDSITLKTYDNYNDATKCGYALKINDSSIMVKDYAVSPTINFADLDKNDSYTEIVVLKNNEDAPDAHYYDIYYYDGNNIKLVFSGELRGFEIETLKEVNDVEFGDGSGDFYINCVEKDTCQSWNINRHYKLDNNHYLYEVKPAYYQNLDEQECISKEDIVLYNSMNAEDISNKQIYAGQQVKIVGTSLDYWIVVNIEGSDYYIMLDRYGQIDELGLFLFEAFDNINAVD